MKDTDNFIGVNDAILNRENDRSKNNFYMTENKYRLISLRLK